MDKEERNFESFYNQELLPELKHLDGDRKKLTLLLWGAILTGVSGFVVSAYYGGGFHEFSLNSNSNADFIIVLALLVGWALLGALFYRYVYKVKLQKIRSAFKKLVIEKIVRFIDPSLHYNENRLITRDEYEASQLFPVKADWYYGEDYVVSKEGPVSYKFSELHTHYTMKDHRGRKAFITIFRGLFFVARVRHHLNSGFVVLPDRAGKVFGKFGKMLRKWNFMRDEVVETGHKEFDREFAVYGDDEQEVRSMLNDNLMQRILNFKHKSGHPVYASFIGSHVNVGISMNKDLFEPPVWGTMMNYGLIEANYQYLNLATGIVRDLDLNQVAN